MSERLTAKSLALAIATAWGTLAAAVPSEDLAAVEVLGALGLAQAQENSCIAVWVSVPEGMSMTGVEWYNNDATVAFPELLVQSGSADYPVALPDAATVATAVTGSSVSWSEVAFSAPVGSMSGGLYVIFRIPGGAQALANGPGGGPAIGYTAAAEGYPGWLSSDGEDWSPVHPDFGFAVRPVLAAGPAGMMFKSGRSPGGIKDDPSPPEIAALTRITTLHPATPNPFNPQTTLRFSLREAASVDLAVFNLKGELIRRLISAGMDAGEHEVTWDGRDRGGMALASGVYLVRLIAGDVTMTQRVLLIQ